jgi:hypothetical protein
MRESNSTHPVYIGKDLKKEVKMEATEHELTMRDVTERLIERGIEKGFHNTPLPSEFEEDLQQLMDDIDDARTGDELDGILETAENIEQRIKETQFPEGQTPESLLSDLESVYNKIQDTRPTVA